MADRLDEGVWTEADRLDEGVRTESTTLIFKGGQVEKNGGQLRGRRTDEIKGGRTEKMADNLEEGGRKEGIKGD